MAAYKTYEWERNTWPEFQTIQIGQSDANQFLNKFSRHFKVQETYIDITRRKSEGHGHYTWSTHAIAVPTILPLSLLIHEFAHHLSYMLYGENGKGHGRKFKRSLKRVYTFAERYTPAGQEKLKIKRSLKAEKKASKVINS